ncbi:MAG: hypothetical protein LUE24_13870 [Lachnospiraceae bacterium]|nr:hypothetical protein [Lachnospiraceae bacterium]
MKKEAEVQQEYSQELFRLIRGNPDLPIVPMVDSEIVADDGYQWWMGSWGKAEVAKYYLGIDRVHFYEPDDWNEVDGTLYDAREMDAVVRPDMDDNTIKEAYEALPWTEAIIVYITLP